MRSLANQQVFRSLTTLLLLSYQSFATSSAGQQTAAAVHPNELVSSASQPHSITRLHQIWTSTSSDRLDELSPELISKMKAGIPFLEAYALRPRMVGASDSSIQPLTSVTHSGKQSQASEQVGLTGQSSERRTNYLSAPSFSGFSELKVESASLSKTEHHHKRTTSLKKRPNQPNNEMRIKRIANGKLVNRQTRPIKDRKRALKSRPKLTRSTIIRANYPASQIALYQDPSTKTNPEKYEPEPEQGQVKGGSDSSEKGGKKEPFYANVAPGRERLDDDKIDNKEETDDEMGLSRVGDEDVEEDGDTVMVEPKSDGVDDDPDIPDYDSSTDEEGGVGGKRVNRGQPPSSEDENAHENEGDSSSSRSDTAGESEPANGKGSSSDAGDESKDVTPGVERAEEDVLNNEPVAEKKEPSEKGRSLDEDYDDEKKNSEGKGKPVVSDNGEDDLEYRDDDEYDIYRGTDEVDNSNKQHDEERDDTDLDEGKKSNRKHNHGHKDEEEDGHEHSIECLEDAVPGEPGLDYPILAKVNSTNFRCSNHKYPGYYADTETRCQVFHYCRPDGTQDSFLCPNGTIFSQKTSVCVWWNSFRCEDAPKYVGLNALLYKQQRAGPQGESALADRHPIDGLIEEMKRPPNKQHQDDKTKTSPNSIDEDDVGEGLPAHSDGKTSSRKNPAAGFDEAAIQRKAPVPDEADVDLANARSRGRRATAGRLSSRTNSGQWKASNNNNNISAAPRRKRRASTRQAPPKLKSSSRRYMRPSRRVAYRIKNVSKPRRRS